jgi:hypothetical protein
MPVDFFNLPPETPNDATPPSPIVWGLLLVIAIATGVALTLFLWPKGHPTHDWRFFTWMFGIPTIVWACGLALHLHSYEIHVWRTQAHNSERAATVAHNTAYARRPLALLGIAYVTAMGHERLAERITGGESALAMREVRNTKEVRAHSELPRDAFSSTTDQLDEVVDVLLTKLKPALQNLPPHASVEVWLDIQDSAAAAGQNAVWDRLNRDPRLRVMAPVMLKADERVMALDAWLDNDSPTTAKYVLVIAVQLRADVPADTGEAAVALLLGWPARVELDRQSAIACVHRPTVSPSDHNRTALDTALEWGAADSTAVERTWISGLTELRRNRDLVHTPPVSSESAPITTSLDSALGHTGAACGWLAIATAAEQCRATGGVQFISTEAQQKPCWLVVQPLPSSSNSSS